MNPLSLRLRQSNPFYLLSAACMLGGCLAITSSFCWSYTPGPRDLWLLGLLNVYEAALIGLAWFLVRRRGLVHDGVVLLALETFFLCDATFINAEVITGNFISGLALNIALFAAAMVKLWCMAKIAGLSLRDGRLAAVAVQLAALFTIPFVFRHFDDGDLPERFFYIAWWMAGLFIPACLGLASRRIGEAGQERMNGVVKLLCIAPWFSLILHLGILHYVYDVTFHGAEAAPVLLGVVCLLHHVKPTSFVTTRDLLFLKVVLPVAAIFISLDGPAPFHFEMARHVRHYITSVDLAAAACYLTYIYCFFRRYAGRFFVAGVVAGLGAVFGPSMREMLDFATRGSNLAWKLAWPLVPKTVVQAGFTAVAAAFGLLGIGAAVSLRRNERALPEEPAKTLSS